MLGGNLDGDQDVVTGGRDDDANRIDLVVRGIGAVEHAGDRVKADLARDAPLQVVLERRGDERQRTVRFAPVAMRSDGCGTGLTGKRRGHLNIVLSRERWGNETPLNWRNRAVGLAPECSTAIVADSRARAWSRTGFRSRIGVWSTASKSLVRIR